MTVEKCLEKYIEFMKIVFPDKYTLTEWIKVGWSGQKWNLEPLENCIKKLISETLGTNKPEDIMLLDDSVTDNNCKVFVVAVSTVGANNHEPVLFRSYVSQPA
ncbi:uncharacterized protein RCO7_14457 [Rhynchosporium graminicola]|uniref:Uncharacterized protein n=1 Tax=Rhynchosporium graminicola TaxID=2792576 RepID=A0A1E1KIL9_9HELO|nr:uncharacterized protein RCO7_14457 [Rhynchosporium commune]